LTGRSRIYDPRVHAVRRDIADIALADWIFAPHYAQAEPRLIAQPSTMLRTAPQPDATAGSQLLFGETFHVLDVQGGWAWGYCGHDHYVGYIAADALAAPFVPTHLIAVREAPVFSEASIKASVRMTLALGARVEGAMGGDFVETDQGFVHRRHVAPIDATLGDPVSIAERLLGAPYLWGGRGAGGVDCSGLVQIALMLAGHDCPRDSDQQGAALGRELATNEPHARGDLIFFPGHVGLMVDAESLLHANAWWMGVVVEPLEDVLARLRPQHENPLTSARRLPS
jgi:hypothetical protein